MALTKITSDGITDGTIVNADINASAAIDGSKISPAFTSDITGTGNFTLTSTDAGSSAAPELELYRNSASPADADYLGQLKFTGESDDGSKEVYAKITGKISDASSGTEDGIIEFAHRKAGSNVITGRFTSTSFKLINGTELEAEGGATITGTCTATTFSGSGASLTSLPSGQLTGALPAIDGSNLTGISGGVSSDSDNNTVGGTNAGDSITNGTQNTFFGFDAGTATTSGNRNSAFGAYALAEHSTSFDNSCFGDGAGRYITTGSMNTCLGRRAGESITTSQSNTIVGLMADAEGSYNVCVGQQAGQYSSGSNSIIIGGFTGQDFTGSSNNFIGYQSAKDATSATENVCIGRGSGLDLSSGSKNVIIGHDSANSGSNDLTSGDNNIIIGHDAAASSATVDNEITLGDGNITKFRIPALSFSISASAVTNGAAFYENAQTVSSDYTITSGNNAMSAGPITINDGVTVTVPSNSTLTIV